MVVGASQSFRLIDENGPVKGNVDWDISDPDAFEMSGDKDLTLVAKRTGTFRVTARCARGGATATVKVLEGSSLPPSTAKWSTAGDGCKVLKSVPAVPSRSGVDVFVHTICEDGQYVAAYTSGGIQVWRRKLGADGLPIPSSLQGAQSSSSSTSSGSSYPVNLKADSVCEAISPGMQQDAVQQMLSRRNLSHLERPAGGLMWMIEEPGVRCDVWFDESKVVTRTRKVLVNY